jgi:hypothetical protein
MLDGVELYGLQAARHLVEEGLAADALLQRGQVLAVEAVFEEVVGAVVHHAHHLAVAYQAVGGGRDLVHAGRVGFAGGLAQATPEFRQQYFAEPEPAEVGQFHLAGILGQQVLQRGQADGVYDQQKGGFLLFHIFSSRYSTKSRRRGRTGGVRVVSRPYTKIIVYPYI